MTTALSILHWLAGLLVVAEAFNKIERTDLFDGLHGWASRLGGLAWLVTPWRWKRHKVILAFKLFGWGFLALGAGGALVTPLLHLDRPSFQDAVTMCGFALLIIRSRLKESPCAPLSQP